jgi:hypothetical protein
MVTENSIYPKHKITPYLKEERVGVTGQSWLGGQKIFEGD